MENYTAHTTALCRDNVARDYNLQVVVVDNG
jgi:hypothetical protein